MLKRLILTDFLAHSSTELEFCRGMTVLTGPNNSGKSAVVEALRCLATNPAPKHFIRHGAKEARVEAEFDDGIRVAWVRKPAYALYEVLAPGATEPVTYAKFGRTPPEDVLAILRLHLVPLEGGKDPVDVHLGNQREPIFLLNRPGSEIASFFASSSESSHLLSMQHLLKERIRKTKAEEKALTSRLAETAASLDRLAPLPDLSLALEEGRGLLDAARAAQRVLPGLEGTLKSMAGLGAKAGRFERELTALTGVQAPPVLWPGGRLAETMAAWQRVASTGRRQARKAAALAPLSPPPALHPVQGLALVAAQAARLSRAEKNLLTRAEALAPLSTPPVPEPLAPLAATVAAMRGLAAREAEAREGLASSLTRLAELRLRVEERLKEIGHCPLCGGELAAEEFMKGEHAHG